MTILYQKLYQADKRQDEEMSRTSLSACQLVALPTGTYQCRHKRLLACGGVGRTILSVFRFALYEREASTKNDVPLRRVQLSRVHPVTECAQVRGYRARGGVLPDRARQRVFDAHHVGREIVVVPSSLLFEQW
jgi:hypothetical protein